jgi:hypothetical protein
MTHSMTHSIRQLALVCALIAGQYACSASNPSSNGSGDRTGSAGSGQAGAPAAGPGNASGGAATGGSSSIGGQTAAAGASTGVSGAAGASAAGGSSTAGASGSSATGGSAGATPICTPGTGTVAVGQSSELDQKTCLTWTKTRSTMTLTNKQAFAYCDGLDQDGISDWRVPRPEELVTWPELLTDSTAYITAPIYIPNDAASVMDGCTGDSHSCNIAKYNDASVTCAWQGVGFAGWVACVSGTASSGTTSAAYTAASCTPCNSELASFTVTDCSAYAN